MNIDDILKEVNNRFKLDTVEYTVEYRDELSKDAEDTVLMYMLKNWNMPIDDVVRKKNTITFDKYQDIYTKVAYELNSFIYKSLYLDEEYDLRKYKRLIEQSIKDTDKEDTYEKFQYVSDTIKLFYGSARMEYYDIWGMSKDVIDEYIKIKQLKI